MRIWWNRGHGSGMCLLRFPVERLWNHCCHTRGCSPIRSTAGPSPNAASSNANAAQIISMQLTGRIPDLSLRSPVLRVWNLSLPDGLCSTADACCSLAVHQCSRPISLVCQRTIRCCFSGRTHEVLSWLRHCCPSWLPAVTARWQSLERQFPACKCDSRI